MNRFLEEIRQQPKALTDTAGYFIDGEGAEALARAVQLWRSGRYDSMLLTGMGSSRFIASAAAAMLAARRIPAVALDAGELLHYRRSLLAERVLPVFISQSGESYEVVRLLDLLPAGCKLVAVCNEAQSTLARRADCLLLTQAGEERMTSTKSFITCYQAVSLLASALAGQPVSSETWNDLAATIAPLVGGCTPWMEPALATIGEAPFVQLIGRGPLFAAVSQSALMFMEAAHLPASAMTGGEFRHGPLEMVREGFAAVVFTHSRSETFAQSIALTEDILRFGGRVVLVTDRDPRLTADNLCRVVVPCDAEELFAVVAVVPLQLLINERMIRRGIEPGDFAHGAKVTARE